MINKEIQNRIHLAVAAYAYEFAGESIMSDADFDKLSYSINPNESTGNEKLDKFFREEFEPCTGMWIYKHPELDKIKKIYSRYYGV